MELFSAYLTRLYKANLHILMVVLCCLILSYKFLMCIWKYKKNLSLWKYLERAGDAVSASSEPMARPASSCSSAAFSSSWKLGICGWRKENCECDRLSACTGHIKKSVLYITYCWTRSGKLDYICPWYCTITWECKHTHMYTCRDQGHDMELEDMKYSSSTSFPTWTLQNYNVL